MNTKRSPRRSTDELFGMESMVQIPHLPRPVLPCRMRHARTTRRNPAIRIKSSGRSRLFTHRDGLNGVSQTAVQLSRSGNGRAQVMPLEQDGRYKSLIDVLDRVLDKGIVIDAWARVSVMGIDFITLEARVVVASIETYLLHAEALSTSRHASRPRLFHGLRSLPSGS